MVKRSEGQEVTTNDDLDTAWDKLKRNIYSGVENSMGFKHCRTTKTK
jgi:hypothetical protein